MFDLEGTKHERAVIVVLAYIIGFTSGFIAFNLSDKSANVDKKDTYSEIISNELETEIEVLEDDIQTTSENNGEVLGEVVESNDFVFYNSDHLYVQTSQGMMVLSVHEKIFEGNVPQEFTEQGIHTEKPVFVANDSDSMVFFCEPQSDSESCMPFVFDARSVMIYPVTVNNTALSLAINEARSASWQGNQLALLSFVSNGTTPWSLVSSN